MGNKLTKQTFQPTRGIDIGPTCTGMYFYGWHFHFNVSLEYALSFYSEISFDIDRDKFNKIKVDFCAILFGIGITIDFEIKNR